MWNSLRGRFLFTAIVLGLIVAVVAHQSEQLVRASYQESRMAIEGFYSLHTVIEDLKRASEDMAATLRRPGSSDRGIKAAIGSEWLKLQTTTALLTADNRIKDQPHFKGLGESLTVMVTRLGDEVRAEAPKADELTRQLTSFDHLIHLVERRVYDAVIDRTVTALDTSDLLAKFIWGLGITWMAASLGGFMAFELVIRRPLLSVAEAMEMEGRLGTFDTKLPAPRSQETATLVKAFASMRAQVQSRQRRLQSILDNTSDGIVTLDQDGLVKSMNPAAELLFGRKAQDIGCAFTDLLGKPPPLWPPNCDGETIIELRRPNAEPMNLSLKFSAFAIHGLTLYTVMVADVTEHQALIGRLTVQAERDALTGLYNRRFFLEELDRMWTRARRSHGARIALLAIDLDHFKFVNDTFGHQAGDQLLMDIAKKLRKRSRQGDVIARLGGDEFAILLFDVNTGSAERIAQSYRLSIADHPFHCDGRTVEIGCSLGVAVLDNSVATMEELMARADLACRIAKSQGRNCHHVFTESDRQDDAAVALSADMAAKARQAMAEDRLRLAYQPIVALSNGDIRYQEVLLRMDDGQSGPLVTAASFFADAERAGFAYDLDRWVMRRSFADFAAGKTPDSRDGLTINLSAQSVGQGELLTEIAALILETGTDPRRLTFEMAETTAVSNLANTREVMSGLKALGCGTAVSGFGSGYCSFLYLRDLPADMVKLDGDLVRRSAADAVSLVMVQSMTKIARALGRTTVAEFIETAEILAAMQAIGVDCGQGFHFAAPSVPLPRPDC